MTIGEKIVHLRIVNNISQEELAKNLKVSRQSLSKWENNDTLPPLNSIKDLCQIFKVSADELIDDNIVIHRGKKVELPDENIKTKYFGTDGFRGEANELLNSDKAYKIGRFLPRFRSFLNKRKHCIHIIRLASLTLTELYNKTKKNTSDFCEKLERCTIIC